MKFSYTEAGNRGLFALNDVGGYIHDISFQAGSGSGGALFSSILTLDAPAAGRLFVERCRFSGGDFVNNSVLLDGQTNATGGPGNRGIRFANCEVFGAAGTAFKCISVLHGEFTGMLMVAGGGSGGTGTVALEIGGITGAFSDGNYVHGEIAGGISLDKTTRTRIESALIQGAITNTSDVATTSIAGTWINSGTTLEHNWDGASCWYEFGSQYADRAAAYLAAAVNDVTGDGTEATIVFDTIIASTVLDFPMASVYDVATGRYSPKRAGFHRISARVAVSGTLAAHTTGEIAIKVFTSGDVEVTGSRHTLRFNPYATLAGTVSAVQINADVYIATTQYAIVTYTVSGGTKVIDLFNGSGMMTSFAAVLI
jgi:hypothetical protein